MHLKYFNNDILVMRLLLTLEAVNGLNYAA